MVSISLLCKNYDLLDLFHRSYCSRQHACSNVKCSNYDWIEEYKTEAHIHLMYYHSEGAVLSHGFCPCSQTTFGFLSETKRMAKFNVPHQHSNQCVKRENTSSSVLFTAEAAAILKHAVFKISRMSTGTSRNSWRSKWSIPCSATYPNSLGYLRFPPAAPPLLFACTFIVAVCLFRSIALSLRNYVSKLVVWNLWHQTRVNTRLRLDV